MKLTVKRSDPDRVESWEVPEFEGMTVLDAILWVREHRDPTLAVRYACRNANACKECLAIVGGRQTYTCTVPATGQIDVAPLPNKTLLRDLVVEL